jgi:hypothetical protein
MGFVAITTMVAKATKAFGGRIVWTWAIVDTAITQEYCDGNWNKSEKRE